jgi:ATP-binding cassette subfamily F protein 3
LDLDGRRLLQDALASYTGTVLIVSHDIDFVRNVATSVLEITPEGIRQFPGGYDYYSEKKAEAVRNGAPKQDSATQVADKAASGDERLSGKELRKRRAEERAKLAPKVKELKRRVETAERKLDELQKALDEASAELFNPTATTDFAEVNRVVRTLQFEIDRYTLDWEEAATELEELTT